MGFQKKENPFFLIGHCSIEQCEFDNDSLLILLLKLIFITIRLKNRFIILVLTVDYKISINTISLKIILKV